MVLYSDPAQAEAGSRSKAAGEESLAQVWSGQVGRRLLRLVSGGTQSRDITMRQRMGIWRVGAWSWLR